MKPYLEIASATAANIIYVEHSEMAFMTGSCPIYIHRCNLQSTLLVIDIHFEIESLAES